MDSKQTSIKDSPEEHLHRSMTVDEGNSILPTHSNNPTTNVTEERTNVHLPQLDGPNDYRTQSIHFFAIPPATQRHTSTHYQRANPSGTPPAAHQPPPAQASAPPNPVTHILPWCTTHMRLSGDQVIALSDVAGSLKELVLLALSSTVDEGAKETLERAVGAEAATGIMDFWVDEWVAD